MKSKRIDELSHLFNERAPIARAFGMRLSYSDEGNAVVDLPYNPDLDDGVKVNLLPLQEAGLLPVRKVV